MRVGRGLVIRKFGGIAGGILLVFLGVGGFFVAGNWLFTIRNVQVVGEGIRVSVDEERFVKNLLLFPTDALRVQLLRDYPLLADVEIRKKYPDTLIIVAHPREPLAIIASEGRAYLVGADGVVLGLAVGGENLPKGYFPVRTYATGEGIAEGPARAFVAFLASFSEHAQVSEATSHDSASIRIRFSQVNIYVAQDANMDEKASTLQTLLAGFRIKGTLPAVIDLRFDKPIVTF